MGFRIEDRGGISVLVWSGGGCRPASKEEKLLWSVVQRIAEVPHLEVGCEHHPDYPCPICTARQALQTKDTACRHSNQRRHNPDGTINCCECGEQIGTEKDQNE